MSIQPDNPTMKFSVDNPGNTVTSIDEALESLDESINTLLRIVRFTDEEFICPCSDCNFSGDLIQLRGHISTHEDFEINSRLNFERYVITNCERACNASNEQMTIDDHNHSDDDETDDALYECPVDQCDYTNTIPSLKGHMSGTHDHNHKASVLGEKRRPWWIKANCAVDDDEDGMTFDPTL